MASPFQQLYHLALPESAEADEYQLQQIIASGGVYLSTSVVAAVMKPYLLRGGRSVSTEEIRLIIAYLDSCWGEFVKLGACSGYLPVAKLQPCAAELSQRNLQGLAAMFCVEECGDQFVDFNGYLGTSILVGRAREVFAFYDNLGTGNVTFALDSFARACSHLV
eukprot:Sspe_Gene.19597::Locus_7150_Transcript_1_1_Confidence_1.000_Length_1035::g.19597::m.19597